MIFKSKFLFISFSFSSLRILLKHPQIFSFKKIFWLEFPYQSHVSNAWIYIWIHLKTFFAVQNLVITTTKTLGFIHKEDKSLKNDRRANWFQSSLNCHRSTKSLQTTYSIESIETDINCIVAKLNQEEITDNYNSWTHLIMSSILFSLMLLTNHLFKK